MSEEPRNKSHAMAWTLLIAAVLVLYVASYGPVIYFSNKYSDPAAEWAARIYEPLCWCCDRSPFKEQFTAYEAWWMPPPRGDF